MLPRFLWRYQWARRRHGGKWERWPDPEGWVPVRDWSTPRERPDDYGRGHTPEREDWTKVRGR